MGLVLVALIAAAPPLTVEQRKALAAPLIEATRVVQKALAKQKLDCRPVPPFDEGKPENWVTAESNWAMRLDCPSDAGLKQLAVQISNSAIFSPAEAVKERGPRFFLRDVGPGFFQLGVGTLLVARADEPIPAPGPGPALSVTVGATEQAVLKQIPVDALWDTVSRPWPGCAPPAVVKAEPPARQEKPYRKLEGTPVFVAAEDAWAPLVRTASPNEEAYFTTVAVRAHRAIALASAAKHCQPTKPPEACTDARWGPRGFEPSCWQSHWTCEGDLSFLAELSGAAPPLRTSGSKGHLTVGEVHTFGSKRPAGGIAALGSVTFDADDVTQLKLDLAPLRALLKAPPELPAQDPPAKEGAPLAAAEREARKAEVRQLALERFAREDTAQLVVFDHTLIATLEPRLQAFLGTALPALARSALDDFAKAASVSKPTPSTAFRLPVRRLSAQEETALFAPRDAGKDGWARYRERYDHASGIIRLSDVGLSVDGTTAVIAVDSQAHWLAGSGETWFLRKTAAGWEKLAVLRRWVS